MKKPSKKFIQSTVRMSYSMGGKMKDILSLSTNCRTCARCIKRHGEGMKRSELVKKVNENGERLSICKCCFAFNTTGFYKSLAENL